MSNDHKENQAIKLQQLFAEVTNQEAMNEIEGEHPEEFVEVDVLQLPPRSEVHNKSKWSMQIKPSSPLVRFIFVIILMLAVIGVLYYVIGEKVILFFSSP